MNEFTVTRIYDATPGKPGPRFEQWAEHAAEEIDSGLFNSDAFLSKETAERLRYLLGRWDRKLKEIESDIDSGVYD